MSEQQALPQNLPEAAIREQLQRMLAHAPFERSPVLSAFLSYVVEHELAADAPLLKEYTLGLEVFNRPDDFDPRIDSIVRVQARRLREALTSYYQNAGRNDVLRLDMPKGQYGIRVTTEEAVTADVVHHEQDAAARAPTMHGVAPLPVPRTALIGRVTELGDLGSMLERKAVRLLSITGVGGSGKTRLALALAEQVREDFPGGVLFLDLSAVTERSVLINMLADVFNVRRIQNLPLLEAIAGRMRSKLTHATLLVLDNMEGVQAGADVLGDLLEASPALSMLVTSRIALRLYGEHEYPLPPLAVPVPQQAADLSRLQTVPSVELFMARALAVNPRADFRHDPGALAELCVRLDGLPLAIELVAAQAGNMTPRQMLERFTGHLDLPENPARDAPSRQRTLRRVIDWSFDLLDESARRALRRLSVFSGGFTREAAEAVADCTGDMSGDLLAALNALVSTGLLHFHGDCSEPRYTMLETLRAYGRERLNVCGEADATRRAHAAYCLVLAEEGVGAVASAQREAWLMRCDLEQDNFRLALEFLLQRGPQQWVLRLGQALFTYWERREKLVEARRMLQRIADSSDTGADDALWAKVSSYAAVLANFQGDHDEAQRRYSNLLQRYRKMGDRKGEAATLNSLGVSERFRHDETEARAWFSQALDLCRAIGDPREVAAALSNLAESEVKLGDTRKAHALLSEARTLFRTESDPVSAAWCLNHLGDVARVDKAYDKAAELYVSAESEFTRLGDPWGLARSLADRGQLALDRAEFAQAGPLLLQALAAFEKLDHQRGMATVADSLAEYALAIEQPELAVRLLAAADSWRAAVGFTAQRDESGSVYGVMKRAEAVLDPAACQAARAAGRMLTSAQVAAAVRTPGKP